MIYIVYVIVAVLAIILVSPFFALIADIFKTDTNE